MLMIVTTPCRSPFQVACANSKGKTESGSYDLRLGKVGIDKDENRSV